ncbi:MAG: hypothetical protein ACOYVD_16310 [Bacillota bacterium]
MLNPVLCIDVSNLKAILLSFYPMIKFIKSLFPFPIPLIVLGLF